MKDVLDTLLEWALAGQPATLAHVVRTQRSAPRGPGAVMALAADGRIAGSVTGGCVEPAVIATAEGVLAGGDRILAEYGYAEEDAFAVGLPCGGSVEILIEPMEPARITEVAAAVEEGVSVAYATPMRAESALAPRVVRPGPGGDLVEAAARRLLATGESGVVELDDEPLFVSILAQRPAMYIFGAVDFASALAWIGRFLGYRVTICDARAAFVTEERFPDADELVVSWPGEFLERAPIDGRTAICVLTHDQKFDVPALRAALDTSAGYIGAMGSRTTTARREERLRDAGLTDEQLARIHAPIGLPIASRTPEEVAVAVGAEIVSVMRRGAPDQARETVR